MQSIYLDNNSTTAVLPEVAEAMHAAYQAGYGNPASQHQAGQRARRLLEDAREEIADLLGARLGGAGGDRLIFTSGGTEANNLALRGLGSARGGSLVVSTIEHPSVVQVARSLDQFGTPVRWLAVTPSGEVRVDLLPGLLEPPCRLVSVMLGNNETGVLQPVREIAACCRAAGVPLHTDAVQAVGKIPVHFRELGVAALTLSAHKFHGPVGIGGLLVAAGVSIEPLLVGGFQQQGLRPGTESLALVFGMREALRSWTREAATLTARLQALRDQFEAALEARLPEVVIHGDRQRRLPHTSNVSFPGLDRQAILMALDLAGVACSTGSACASGSSEPSPVLLAMGLDARVVAGSLRISFSRLNEAAEIPLVVERMCRIIHKLRTSETLQNQPSTARTATAKSL